VVAIYSTFLQRAYDQLIHDVALQHLPVTFAIDRGGLVGGDGATHQGSFDLSYLRCIPNMVVMAPADENECRQMLYTATTLDGPAAVRYPRGQGPGVAQAREMTALAVGQAEVRREGKSGLLLLAFGTMVAPCVDLADRLDATLVNMRFVKPLDSATVCRLAASHSCVVTLEENVVAGGAGSAVGECLAQHGIGVTVHHVGIPDRFIEHGTREQCLAMADLDPAGIARQVQRIWAEHRPARPAVASRA
jgi:1-deoxy-D-xylulose-5-phosphate synthase